MADAIATGLMPDWAAEHMSSCVACRRGLAYVVARATPSLSPQSRDMATHVAFVARVRGLAREIAEQRRARCAPPQGALSQGIWRARTQPSTCELSSWDWRLPAGIALLVAVASAGLAAWLIVTSPQL